MMHSYKTRNTKSGLIIRYDDECGLFAYSPYNGLVFAIHPNHADAILAWLDKKSKKSLSTEYSNSLGAGWFTPLENAKYAIPNLLPIDDNLWGCLPKPKWPIVINWFITGNCPLACAYCYAEDLMRGKSKEPLKSDIHDIANKILSYNPLLVVLTGGDPLFTPNLSETIQQLYGKVGLMVDTCGYTFNENHLNLFKKYNVAVRISIDSEIPKVNKKQRFLHSDYRKLKKNHNDTLSAAVDALCQCLDAGITISVQTVVTKNNANDLEALGDKLIRLGVRSWRIHKVAPSNDSMRGYLKLLGSERQQKNLYKHTFSNLLKILEGRWQRRMAVQVTYNEAPNAVILVAPDGIFYTESNVKPSKVVIDETNTTKPSHEAIISKVNIHAHAERYLNITSMRHMIRS